MALHTQFHRKLDRLWHRRTAELRALIHPKAGTPLAFSRRVRNRMLDELLDIATKLLVRRHAKASLEAACVGRRLHHIKGRGLVGRGNDLVAFAGTLSGPIVYSFWRGKRCLYVGKGAKSSRLFGYQKSAYVTSANTVEVLRISSRAQLPKAECLATHIFAPRDLKIRPSKVKWGKKCPVCIRHDALRRELRSLFSMR